MKKNMIAAAVIVALLSTSLLSCKKDDKAPVPDEQELITTLKLRLSHESTGFSKVFVYKVENGFGSTSGGTIQIDTLHLEPGMTYDAILSVLNEKEDPAEDITNEILEKDEEHLFVFASNPATGAGSATVSHGSKDKSGKPLNQTFQLTTGASGNGSFSVTLLHLPTNKNGTSPETAGGETDLSAIYPVQIR